MTPPFNKFWIMAHNSSVPCHKWYKRMFTILIGSGSLTVFQCAASTRILGLFKMVWWCVKSSVPITGKGRAKRATTSKRFLINIIPIVTSNGSWTPTILIVIPCYLKDVLCLCLEGFLRSSVIWTSVSMRVVKSSLCVFQWIIKKVFRWLSPGGGTSSQNCWVPKLRVLIIVILRGQGTGS